MTTMILGEAHHTGQPVMAGGGGTGRSVRASGEFNNMVRTLAVTAGLRIVVED